MKSRCRREHDHSSPDYPVYASVKNPNAKLFHCRDLKNECPYMKAAARRANPHKYPWVERWIPQMRHERKAHKRPSLRPCEWCFPRG